MSRAVALRTGADMKTKPINPYHVALMYSVRLDAAIDMPAHKIESIDRAIEKLSYTKRHDGVTVNANTGGPCWAAYWEFESWDADALARFCIAVHNIAKRRNITFWKPEG